MKHSRRGTQTRKKWTALLLSCALCLGLAAPAAATEVMADETGSDQIVTEAPVVETGEDLSIVNSEQDDATASDGISDETDNSALDSEMTVSANYTGFVDMSANYSTTTWGYYKNGVFQSSVTDIIKGTVAQNTGWWYVKDGYVLFETTVAKNSSGWWYVEQGKVNFDYTGLAGNSYGYWYAVKGKVDFTVSGLIKTVKEGTTNWYYIENGKLSTATSVVKNDNGWFYIKNGVVDFTYTGVAENSFGKWYVKNGVLDTTVNGLVKSSDGWYYVKNGKVQDTLTSVEKNDYGWWYVKDGKVDFTFNGLAKNSYGWWYCKNGKVDFTATDIVENDYGSWYVKNGKVDFTYDGAAVTQNGTWMITDGKVDVTYTSIAKVNNEWCYFLNGEFDDSYTGVEKNSYGWWYVKNGKVDFTYTGLAKNSYGWWYCANGKVGFNYTGLCKNEYGWWYCKKSKVDFTYTGIASNTYGYWYINSGKVDFSYSGTITYNGNKVTVKNGMVVSSYVGSVYIDGNGKVSSSSTSYTGTLKALLMNAKKPLGQCLYVWGGGHDTADATRIGVNPNWATYFNSQDSSYDYTTTRFKYGYGLDCSGFVGWTVYNTLNTKSGQSLCTTTSSSVGSLYTELGLGYVTSGSSKTYKPGDIMFGNGHTWMVIGACSDGSVVLIHSTPGGGVQLAGTATPSGAWGSQAIQLSDSYMKKYYPSFVAKFGTGHVSFLSKNYSQLRLNTTSGKLSDPDGIQSMSAAQVLKVMFGE